MQQDTGRIDMDDVARIAREVRPKLLICGASAYARDWDYARFREIADEVGALLLADIAHTAGLIATGQLNNPMPHCHMVTSTTHKTLRGPRGGIIMLGKDYPNPMGKATKKGDIRKMSSVLDSGVFPGTQGGPLEHVIAAKAVAFQEALQPSFTEYTKRVIENARVLSEALVVLVTIWCQGGTDNHLMLIDLSKKGITGKDAEALLGIADITANKTWYHLTRNRPLLLRVFDWVLLR